MAGLPAERAGDKIRHTDVADFKHGSQAQVDKVLAICKENVAWAKQSDRDVTEHMVQAALMKTRLAAQGRDAVGTDEATIAEIFDVIWKRLALTEPTLLKPSVEYQFQGETFQNSALKNEVNEILELLQNPEKRRQLLMQMQGQGNPNQNNNGGQQGYGNGGGFPMEGAQNVPGAATGYGGGGAHPFAPQNGGGQGGGGGGGGRRRVVEEDNEYSQANEDDPYKHSHTLCLCKSCKDAEDAGGAVRCKVCGDDLSDKEIAEARKEEDRTSQNLAKERELMAKEKQKEEEDALKRKEEYEKGMKKR